MASIAFPKFSSQVSALIAVVAWTTFLSPGHAAPSDPPGFPFSPFGIGADAHTGGSEKALEKWIPQMELIGVTVLRSPNTTWGAVEGSGEGQWNWKNLDSEMDYLDAHHMKYGALLYGNVKWNTLDKGNVLPVNNIPAWSKYVTELTKHVNGRVKFFEVWNEPPNGTGREQTPADYAKLVAASYDAVHAVDPTASVGIAAKSVDINYLYQAIQGGAKDHFDYIVLHPYETLGIAVNHPGAEAIFMNIVPSLRKMLAARDPAKINVPVWFTELGSDAKKDPEAPALSLVKAYTMGIAQGVACISWFEGMDGDSGPMGMMKSDGTPRPAYNAMTQMIQYLGERPTYLGLVMLHDKNYGFVFQGVKSTVLIAWAPIETTDPIDFGAPVNIIDSLSSLSHKSSTYTLTNRPILVDGVPNALVQKAMENKDNFFPWDGDYSHAKSVSVTFGVTNIEKGLHTHSAASISADVITYGGSARSGSVPGGNAFMVDPSFLSYDSTPIEITVVVRRNAANENAGFKLNYESTSGFKDFGWYTVPDNKQWYTKSWKTTDAQFVNMYGFNFSLNSDGNQFNKYDIQSVTVTKLDH